LGQPARDIKKFLLEINVLDVITRRIGVGDIGRYQFF
jgi:hypothetical protein